MPRHFVHQLGIGIAKAARRALKKSGFDLVYDRSYPVEPQDMTAIMTEVMQLNPDSFVAFSYPLDTLAITERARALSFNPKIFYTAVGTAFPLYKQRFGADAKARMDEMIAALQDGTEGVVKAPRTSFEW